MYTLSENSSTMRYDLPRGSRPMAWGWAMAIAALGAACCAGFPAAAQAAAPEKPKHALLIRIDQPLGPFITTYIGRQLDRAQEEHADLIIFEIDSSGGPATEGLALAKRLADIDWAYTIAYVPHKATGTAAYVALGCDEIVLHPEARFGNSYALVEGEHAPFDEAGARAAWMQELQKELESIVSRQGRPRALASALVNRRQAVGWYEEIATQKRTFWTDEELAAAGGPAAWKPLRPLFTPKGDEFFELSGTSARDFGIASHTAPRLEELAKELHVADQLTTLAPTTTDWLAYILNLPFVVCALFVAGAVCLILELKMPGVTLFASLSLVFFGLFFWSQFLGGTAGWLEVMLFLLGGMLVLCEIFVIPGFGVSGVLGIVLVFSSLVLAMQTAYWPTTQYEMRSLTSGLGTLVVSGIAIIALVLFISKHLHHVPVMGQIALTPPDPEPEPLSGSVHADGVEVDIPVGSTGVSVSVLRPAGKVRIGRHFIDALADCDFIPAGRPIEVIEARGARIVVHECSEASAEIRETLGYEGETPS